MRVENQSESTGSCLFESKSGSQADNATVRHYSGRVAESEKFSAVATMRYISQSPVRM
jgi:hypothetical protein